MLSLVTLVGSPASSCVVVSVRFIVSLGSSARFACCACFACFNKDYLTLRVREWALGVPRRRLKAATGR